MDNLKLPIAGTTLISLCFIFFVYTLARRERLSFRYAIGWMSLFIPGLLATVIVPLITPMSEAFAISPAAMLTMVFLLLLVTICIQLSISISGLQEQVRTLSEEVAQHRLTFERSANDE
jgi:hypothetical protein